MRCATVCAVLPWWRWLCWLRYYLCVAASALRYNLLCLALPCPALWYDLCAMRCSGLPCAALCYDLLCTELGCAALCIPALLRVLRNVVLGYNLCCATTCTMLCCSALPPAPPLVLNYAVLDSAALPCDVRCAPLQCTCTCALQRCLALVLALHCAVLATTCAAARCATICAALWCIALSYE